MFVWSLDFHLDILEIDKHPASLELHSAQVFMNAKPATASDEIPVEIMSRIFSFCLPFDPCPDFTDWGPSDFPRIVEDLHSPVQFTLGSICHRWRDIAWKTPELWNIMSLYTSRLRLVESQIIQDWLFRSGQLPLFIHICVSPDTADADVEDIFDVVNQYLFRCKVLELESFWHLLKFLHFEHLDGSKTLERLQITDRGDHRGYKLHLTPSQTPKLLALNRVFLSKINIHWDNITSFTVTHICTNECLEILVGMRQLVHCAFLRVIPLDSPHTPPTSSFGIIVLSLKSLTMGKGSNDLWACLSCPSLELLICTLKDDKCSDLPVPFIIRSGCPLRSLSIRRDQRHGAGSDLLSLFKITPKLEELLIRYTDVEDDFFLSFNDEIIPDADGGSKHKPLLPLLRSFHFQGSRHFNWSSVLSLTPTHGVGVHRPLRFVRFDIEARSSDDRIDQESLSLMLQVISRGVWLTVKDYGGRDMISDAQNFYSKSKVGTRGS